ncbi:pre-mRNA-splicing factor prpf38b [Acrasis kona]|uniref:Pre-mRNA-splicing factor 38 n=1 Tax=Acrasis kona TaxID=1008807 RepID=A0AAW2Z5V9_9EUKA
MAENTNDTRPNKLNIWGDKKTMNLPEMLYKNITQSKYFKDLYTMNTYGEVLSEIKLRVNSVLPSSNTGAPSILFSLLLKLFTLKLTRKQLKSMLSLTDAPGVRACAVLYIRFAVEPKEMLEYVDPYLKDQHKIKLTPSESVTFAEFIRGCFTNTRYLQSVLLPRLPSAYEKEFSSKMSHEDKQKDEHSDKKRHERPYDDRHHRHDERDRSSRYSPYSRRRSTSPHTDRYTRSSKSHEHRQSHYRRRSRSPDSYRRDSRSPPRRRSRSRSPPRKKSPSKSPPRSPVHSRFSKPPTNNNQSNSSALSEYEGKVLGNKSTEREVMKLGTKRPF